jgi:AcrR family transcriptional regulator
LNFEAEFDRAVDALFSHRPQGGGRCSENTQPHRDQCSIESIYAGALQIINERGVAALTYRALAGDLKMSTRTLRKRVGKRDRLMRRTVEHHVGTHTVDVHQRGSWQTAIQKWCSDLYVQLVACPHITELMVDSDSRLLDQQIRNLAEYTVQQGIPFDVARQCCTSLARMTMNDAIARCRRRATAVERVEPSIEDQPFDTVRWVVAGVRAELAQAADDHTTRVPS